MEKLKLGLAELKKFRYYWLLLNWQTPEDRQQQWELVNQVRIFKHVVPKGHYHILSAITISLYVCVDVKLPGVTQHGKI